MTDFEEILRGHAASYPNMEPRDAAKLCYQAEFGGEHLLCGEADLLPLLREEFETAPADCPLTEPVGEDVLRFYLGPARESGLPPELVARLFLRSAGMRRGSRRGLELRLKCLEACAPAFAFPDGALDAFLRQYRADGCPAMHHSDRYRGLYRPAYRLLSAVYVPLLPALERIEALRRTRERVVVALDGNCGGGKTTLADLLAPLYNAPVIRMDDFFLPTELQNQERRRRGNVHYERFVPEVLEPLAAGIPFDYRVFSCREGGYHGTVHVEPSPVTVVEGTYSCHPRMGPAYDLRIFVETTLKKQKARILRRSGEECWLRFRDQWIPLETEYFASNRIREQADLIIRT